MIIKKGRIIQSCCFYTLILMDLKLPGMDGMEAVTQPRHQFLLLEVTNSISSEETISYGTGLSNISRTVDKYQGSMELEQTDGRFRLSVLLCLGAGGNQTEYESFFLE